MLLSELIFAQYITTSESMTDEQLVKDIFIGPENIGCISVSNISIKGGKFSSGEKSYGYFNKNGSDFQMENGILLTTGKAAASPGPNDKLLSDNILGWNGDIDLENALNIRNTSNSTVLEFDFITYHTNYISFDYLFASEQYLRPDDIGNCGYTDGFAFLIKEAGSADNYKNLAVIPGTDTPITSENVRGSGGKCPESNQEYFGQYNPDQSPINYNGQTKILTAFTSIIPGVKYHIKLVIADQGNFRYDSAVFLKAGSFTGKKDLGQDMLLTNNNPLCEGNNKILDATVRGAVSYQWYKDGIKLITKTNPTLNIDGIASNQGNYEVEINLGGCLLKGNIRIEIAEKPNILVRNISFCENSAINFDEITKNFVNNSRPYFIPKYYLTKNDALFGIGTPLQNGWIVTQDTKVYVRIENTFGCDPVQTEVNFMLANKIPLLQETFTQDICDNNLEYDVSFDLNDYKTAFHPTLQPTFFNSLEDALKNVNSILSNQKINAPSKTFWLRFEDNTIGCPTIGSIIINKKTLKKSETLKDNEACSNQNILLDAGPGFDYYKWSNGLEGISAASISATVGEHYVDLSFNGCVYRQYVKVNPYADPIINEVRIDGNKAEIFVSGGTKPYLYSLDGINWQASQRFENLPFGAGKIYVKDAKGCNIISQDFLIISLINTITPNGDGINDVLDFSDFHNKKNVSIKIFDRYGKIVYESSNKSFKWDGNSDGRRVPTGTYWCILRWTEPDTNENKMFSSWILVKSKE